ncbi:Putative ribonuclease H protein [Arachis hypogaea]|nr:Putative ribonuclease H protein [Arachis hypogaea]
MKKGGQVIAKTRIEWKPPPIEWVKLNTNGLVIESVKTAGCGGLIRTHEGDWVGGFMANLGNCHAFRAELWGVFHGLNMAWDLGMRRIIIETDSLEVYKEISKERKSQNYNSLVREIQKLKDKSWEIKVMHTHRSGNASADHLAKVSIRKQFRFYFLNSPSEEMKDLLLKDVNRDTNPSN